MKEDKHTLPTIGNSANWQSQKMIHDLVALVLKEVSDIKEQLKYKRRPGAPEFVGATSAAEFYGVSKSTIYRIADDPKTCVNRYKPNGGNTKFKFTELEEYFNGIGENDR